MSVCIYTHIASSLFDYFAHMLHGHLFILELSNNDTTIMLLVDRYYILVFHLVVIVFALLDTDPTCHFVVKLALSL